MIIVWIYVDEIIFGGHREYLCKDIALMVNEKLNKHGKVGHILLWASNLAYK